MNSSLNINIFRYDIIRRNHKSNTYVHYKTKSLFLFCYVMSYFVIFLLLFIVLHCNSIVLQYIALLKNSLYDSEEITMYENNKQMNFT